MNELMDIVKLIKQFPQIWDRTHPQFRDKETKDNAWNQIGSQMGCAGDTCRETFKSIREKYIREKEKAVQHGDNYREWDLLPELKFLDPHIVHRKQSMVDEGDSLKKEGYMSRTTQDAFTGSMSQTIVDKSLINLVKRSNAIWDRSCNNYSNKQLKLHLWQNIGVKLDLDPNSCMLRWKALREKYVRQKLKYQQDGDKWELLDDMSFLDKVIHYRKKYSCNDINQQRTNFTEDICNVHQTVLKQNEFIHLPQETDSNLEIAYEYDNEDDNSVNESSNDYQTTVKQEVGLLQLPDSSYNNNERKRTMSFGSEEPKEKRIGTDDIVYKGREPEDLFGDLVAAMLKRIPEKQRSVYMIEIMTVLSK